MFTATALVAVPLMAIAVLTRAPAATGEATNPLGFTHGFTTLTFGDAHFANAEIEGTIAVGGDISFGKGYPMVHTTGLTPAGYTLPVVDGDPTRLLVGGQFDHANSQGVSQASSADGVNGGATAGYVKIGDLSNVTISPRGSNGLWIGPTPNEAPAIEVTDSVAQPEDTVAAPGEFESIFAGAQAAASDTAQNLAACAGAENVELRPGADQGRRLLTLVEGKTNVLTLTPDQLGSYNIYFEGEDGADAVVPGPDTVLVINIDTSGADDPMSVEIPAFQDDAMPGQPSHEMPNPFAPYTLWNFGDTTATIELTGRLISGSILAPNADLHTNANSPIEGQIVSDTLTTAGGEFHHYSFLGLIDCETGEATTTTTEATTTTTEATTTTTEATTTTTEATTTTTEGEDTTTTTEATTTTTEGEDTTTTTEATTTTTEATTTTTEATTTTTEGEDTTTTTEATTTTEGEDTTTTTEGEDSTTTTEGEDSTTTTVVDGVTSSTIDDGGVGDSGFGSGPSGSAGSASDGMLSRTGSSDPKPLAAVGVLAVIAGVLLLRRRAAA